MKLSTVCPAPAGSVLIRDTRAWHGGTPNLSDQIRAMPNAEFHAPWYREPMNISMPREIYETLSEHGQRIARYVVADPGQKLKTGIREIWAPRHRRSEKEIERPRATRSPANESLPLRPELGAVFRYQNLAAGMPK